MGAIAGPVIGAGIGAFSSQEAAGQASDAQKRAADQIAAAAAEARADALRFFPLAKQELLTGAQGAFDVFGRAIPLQQQQLTAGNLAAQQSAAQGFDQAQAALLGLPTQQFQTGQVPFSPDPFLGGQSLFGTPLDLFPGGSDAGTIPTFAGLGGSFADPRAGLVTNPTPEQAIAGAVGGGVPAQPVNPIGAGGLGTPIPNPNLRLTTPGRISEFLGQNTQNALAAGNLFNRAPLIPQDFQNPEGAENILGAFG